MIASFSTTPGLTSFSNTALLSLGIFALWCIYCIFRLIWSIYTTLCDWKGRIYNVAYFPALLNPFNRNKSSAQPCYGRMTNWTNEAQADLQYANTPHVHRYVTKSPNVAPNILFSNTPTTPGATKYSSKVLRRTTPVYRPSPMSSVTTVNSPTSTPASVTIISSTSGIEFPPLPRSTDYDALDSWKQGVERIFRRHSIPMSDWLPILADDPRTDARLVSIIRNVQFDVGPGASPSQYWEGVISRVFRCAKCPRPWERFSTLQKSLITLKQSSSLELYLLEFENRWRELAIWACDFNLEDGLPTQDNLITLLIQGLDSRCSSAVAGRTDEIANAETLTDAMDLIADICSEYKVAGLDEESFTRLNNRNKRTYGGRNENTLPEPAPTVRTSGYLPQPLACYSLLTKLSADTRRLSHHLPQQVSWKSRSNGILPLPPSYRKLSSSWQYLPPQNLSYRRANNTTTLVSSRVGLKTAWQATQRNSIALKDTVSHLNLKDKEHHPLSRQTTVPPTAATTGQCPADGETVTSLTVHYASPLVPSDRDPEQPEIQIVLDTGASDHFFNSDMLNFITEVNSEPLELQVNTILGRTQNQTALSTRGQKVNIFSATARLPFLPESDLPGFFSSDFMVNLLSAARLVESGYFVILCKTNSVLCCPIELSPESDGSILVIPLLRTGNTWIFNSTHQTRYLIRTSLLNKFLLWLLNPAETADVAEMAAKNTTKHMYPPFAQFCYTTTLNRTQCTDSGSEMTVASLAPEGLPTASPAVPVGGGGRNIMTRNHTESEQSLSQKAQFLQKLHLKLGHANIIALNKLHHSTTEVSEVPRKYLCLDEKCLCCLRIKSKQILASKHNGEITKLCTTQRNFQPLEKLHADLAGPLKIRTHQGAKHFLVITDQATRFRWVLLVPKKDDVPELLQRFFRDLLAEFGTNIKILILQTDCGSEFKNQKLSTILQNAGIRPEYSCPYTPSQNGIAESSVKRIKEITRAFMDTSNLPQSLWGFAAVHAARVANLIPHRLLNFQTPFQLLYGYYPSLNKLPVFGCYACVHRRNNKGSLVGSTVEGIYLGDANPLFNTKGHLVYGPKSKRFFISTSVAFDESLFPCRPKSSRRVTDLQDISPLLTENDLEYPDYSGSDLPEQNEAMNAEQQSGNTDCCTDHTNQESLESVPGNVHKQTEDAEPTIKQRTSLKTLSRKQLVNALIRNKVQLELPSYFYPDETPGTWTVMSHRREQRNKQTFLLTKVVDCPVPDDIGKIIPLKTDNSEFSLQKVLDLQFRAPQYLEDLLSLQQGCTSPEESVPPTSTAYFTSSTLTYWQQIKEPKSIREAYESEHRDKWMRALQDEMTSLEQKLVYTTESKVPPGTKSIPCKPVFKVKTNSDGTLDKFKARVVVLGYRQVKGIDYEETFAPFVDLSTIRLLFALAVEHNYHIHHADVKTAFLNANIDKEIYTRPPKDLLKYLRAWITGCPPIDLPEDDRVFWKLQRALYGTKQAPNLWSITLRNYLLQLGFRDVGFEKSVYIRRKPDGGILIVLVWVDDVLLFGNTLEPINEFKAELNSKFPITDKGEVEYFLGVEIKRDLETGSITLSQEKFINEILTEFEIDEKMKAWTPGTTTKQKCSDDGDDIHKWDQMRYQQLIGKLNYLSVFTRPDLAYTISRLSQHLRAPTVTNWKEAMRVLHYLNQTKTMGITFKRTGNLNSPPSGLIAYSDSDFGGDSSDRRSTIGILLQYNGAPIVWKAKKLKLVTLSTAESEYCAGAKAGVEIIYIRQILEDLGLECINPTTLYIDNQAAICIAKNPGKKSLAKHIDIKRFFLRQLVEENTVNVQYVPTSKMLADLMTKSLGRYQHMNLTKQVLGQFPEGLNGLDSQQKSTDLSN